VGSQKGLVIPKCLIAFNLVFFASLYQIVEANQRCQKEPILGVYFDSVTNQIYSVCRTEYIFNDSDSIQNARHESEDKAKIEFYLYSEKRSYPSPSNFCRDLDSGYSNFQETFKVRKKFVSDFWCKSEKFVFVRVVVFDKSQ